MNTNRQPFAVSARSSVALGQGLNFARLAADSGPHGRCGARPCSAARHQAMEPRLVPRQWTCEACKAAGRRCQRNAIVSASHQCSLGSVQPYLTADLACNQEQCCCESVCCCSKHSCWSSGLLCCSGCCSILIDQSTIQVSECHSRGRVHDGRIVLRGKPSRL